MGFSRQEYWSGLPFPSPVDRPNPRIQPASPMSPALEVDSLLLNHHGYIFVCDQLAGQQITNARV